MSKSKFITQETTKTVVDSFGRTIEVTESKIVKANANAEPFFMVYCQQLAPLYNLTSASAIRLLVKLMEMAAFNEGVVSLTPGVRDKILLELDLSQSAITKALSLLLKSNLILEVFNKTVDCETGEVIAKKSKGEYLINPAILWKGDHSKRKQLLRAGCTITFTPEFEEETVE